MEGESSISLRIVDILWYYLAALQFQIKTRGLECNEYRAELYVEVGKELQARRGRKVLLHSILCSDAHTHKVLFSYAALNNFVTTHRPQLLITTLTDYHTVGAFNSEQTL